MKTKIGQGLLSKAWDKMFIQLMAEYEETVKYTMKGCTKA